ncbi:sarcosine oxidase-like protein [Cercophora newfieldiana]|uniref:Sarcosine oxidase-like protein n=1 Tax=Cercophora newfieldiana TaxID=92897 RepID=A0AA39YLD3_9PEZI|nr:sarcosine oxidase-like protein [Cercophora newfieldiana]
MADPAVAHDAYVIVGAGVFGSSIALHLIREYPSAHIVLIDRAPFPSQVGASWDWNKVIRADYTNPLYVRLALEAMEHWRADPLYEPFYHQSGLAWVDNKDLARTIVDNYDKLGASEKTRLITPDEARGLWGGVHSDANYYDSTEVFLNESSGWADAAKTLTKVIETAVAAGVKYVVAEAKEIVFDEQGSTVGIRTAKGELLSASHVILATGATTAKLLADSAPQRKEMQADGRVIAAAICEGMVTLSDEDAAYFRQGPCFLCELGYTQGGSMPPTSDNQLKIYRDQSFTNTVYHEASGQHISIPPESTDYGQWELSPLMKEEVSLVFKGIFGKKAENWEFHNYRVCWDAITPSQDLIICEHPHSKNLYLATGGSFHSWKFLPIIGKYVVQLLKGTLDADLVETWAWDRESSGSAHKGVIPTREMRDV